MVLHYLGSGVLHITSGLAQGRGCRNVRVQRARLVVAALLPWLVLTLSNGGRHNHSLRDRQRRTCYVAAGGVPGPERQPLHAYAGASDVPPSISFCLACRWQVSSSTSPVGGTAESVGQRPSILAQPPQILLCAPVGRFFDSRGPPLV